MDQCVLLLSRRSQHVLPVPRKSELKSEVNGTDGHMHGRRPLWATSVQYMRLVSQTKSGRDSNTLITRGVTVRLLP